MPLVADWLDEVYAAINTLQERVLHAQNNVKRGLANIDAWGNIPLHNRRTNPDKLELLDINGRMPRFVIRSVTLRFSKITSFWCLSLKTNLKKQYLFVYFFM